VAKEYSKTDVLIVGAGPAGLAAAITIKKNSPQTEVCVIDKAPAAGNHNLSGAALEPGPLHDLLDLAVPDWQNSEQAQKVLSKKVTTDNVMFMVGKKFSVNIAWKMKIMKAMKLCLGQMSHEGDYNVSISELTAWLSDIATDLGAEVLYGFAAEEIVNDKSGDFARGVKLVDQGLDKHQNKQPNYKPGEVVEADVILLAEGCDGLLSEKFIDSANLKRHHHQLYSVGVKEVIRVSQQQYEKFSDNRAVHAMGYPLWTPVLGPSIFGGGVMYPVGDNRIAVGLIAGLDWKYCDFNPQDALVRFKETKFVNQFIEGGTVVEAGAKMIPEAGYYGIPRDPNTNTVGKTNVILIGDSAGFVNMLKIKGLHNAIDSGMTAGRAVCENLDAPKVIARVYTRMLDNSRLMDELRSAKHFRQTIGKFGMLFGLPMVVLNGLLPKFSVEKDYEVMKNKEYPHKPQRNFDKDTFTALAQTQHREEEPCHLNIIDPSICMSKCGPAFNSPCITFCPAGVYETIHSEVKAANPSNCLHCKTCQRKCPFDNIRWTVPEGSGGPRYQNM
jgi:electron-transferring-flavoprotein dehydrogenase